MNDRVSDRTFIFNEEIDTQCITDLYGDDYAYVEEVFCTVLSEYDKLTENILAAYGTGDLQALKSAVHKIKPVFGFVGLPALQNQCQELEQHCQSSSSFDQIESDYISLKNKLIRSKSVIEEEKKKLDLFNRQRS